MPHPVQIHCVVVDTLKALSAVGKCVRPRASGGMFGKCKIRLPAAYINSDFSVRILYLDDCPLASMGC